LHPSPVATDGGRDWGRFPAISKPYRNRTADGQIHCLPVDLVHQRESFRVAADVLARVANPWSRVRAPPAPPKACVTSADS
jgi:hypothetical protein